MSSEIVNLSPRHSGTSSTLVIAKFWKAPFPKPLARRKNALPGHPSNPGYHEFRSLRYFLTAFLSSVNYSPPVLPFVTGGELPEARQILPSKLHHSRCKLSPNFFPVSRPLKLFFVHSFSFSFSQPPPPLQISRF